MLAIGYGAYWLVGEWERRRNDPTFLDFDSTTAAWLDHNPQECHRIGGAHRLRQRVAINAG